MNTQTSISNQIERFKKLSVSKKIAIIGSVIFIIIAIGITSLYVNKPNYDVLFSQLRDDDPLTVTTKLDELKIDYQLVEESDGTITILVPSKDKAKALVDVSSTFSPTSSTVGYEILDSISFGETEKDRQQKRKRALEGELVRTLQMLPSINWARVHLDIPETSILKVSEDDVDTASASVTLSLKNQNISTNQIKGIIKIVSNSVQGLDPADVEVIDENMNVLSEGIFNNDSQNLYSTEDTSKLEKNLEKELSSKAKRLLETIVGHNNVAVEVDALMNFDVKEIVEDKFGKSVPISEHTIEKDSEVLDNASTTVPGTDSNADTEDYTTSDTGSQKQKETYSETTTNYETEKTTSKTLKSNGEIERLTISVVVNEKALQNESGVVNQQLKEELLKNAKTAIGFNEERNDEIQFTIVPFNETLEVEEKSVISTIITLSTPITTIIVIILGFILILFTIKKSYSILSQSKPIEVMSSKNDFQDLSSTLKSNVKTNDSDEEDEEFLDLSYELDINQKRINKIIDTDPEQVRKVLRQYKKNLE